MKRTIRAGMLATGLLVAFTSVAFGAQPNHRACFGADISGYALAGGGLHYLPALVQAAQPFGQVVQAHQAGLVPEWLIPNSCND